MIADAVSGAGVEGDHVAEGSGGREIGEVGDAADIEQDAGFARIAEEAEAFRLTGGTPSERADLITERFG